MKTRSQRLLARYARLTVAADRIEGILLGDSLSASQRKSLNRRLGELVVKIEEVRVEMSNTV